MCLLLKFEISKFNKLIVAIAWSAHDAWSGPHDAFDFDTVLSHIHFNSRFKVRNGDEGRLINTQNNQRSRSGSDKKPSFWKCRCVRRTRKRKTLHLTDSTEFLGYRIFQFILNVRHTTSIYCCIFCVLGYDRSGTCVSTVHTYECTLVREYLHHLWMALRVDTLSNCNCVETR